MTRKSVFTKDGVWEAVTRFGYNSYRGQVFGNTYYCTRTIVGEWEITDTNDAPYYRAAGKDTLAGARKVITDFTDGLIEIPTVHSLIPDFDSYLNDVEGNIQNDARTWKQYLKNPAPTYKDILLDFGNWGTLDPFYRIQGKQIIDIVIDNYMHPQRRH